MSYRKIVVAGRNFKWLVGRSNIEIRHDDDGKPFKMVLPRRMQNRWGVISPTSTEKADSLGIEIFVNKNEALEFLEAEKQLSSNQLSNKDKIELVRLPDKNFEITPEWVRQKVETQLSVKYKARV